LEIFSTHSARIAFGDGGDRSDYVILRLAGTEFFVKQPTGHPPSSPPIVPSTIAHRPSAIFKVTFVPSLLGCSKTPVFLAFEYWHFSGCWSLELGHSSPFLAFFCG
jgi:hypothetical protein